MSRKRPLERRPLNANQLAADVLRIVRSNAILRNVALRAELAHALPAVEGDRVSLQQVLIDLIVNAMDAMEGVEGEREVVVRTRLKADAIEIAVSDTGRGIPPELEPRLFEPFFTTKPEGLGLGLAIARSIAEAHGGELRAENNDGPGASFPDAPAPELASDG